MNQWKQSFSKKMDNLREQTESVFETWAGEVLESTFSDMVDFLGQWQVQVSTPQNGPGRRSYKFGLAEDAYLLVLFRADGISGLQCEYEYCIPGEGRGSSTRQSTSLKGVEPDWAESCLQQALDEFVTRFSESEQQQRVSETAMV